MTRRPIVLVIVLAVATTLATLWWGWQARGRGGLSFQAHPAPRPSVVAVTDAERHVDRLYWHGPLVPGAPLIRILLLTNWDTFNTLMHRHPYDFLAAMKRHPWVRADMWGPGFSGWNTNASAEDNVIRRYGGPDAWDIVFTWPAMDLRDAVELRKHAVIATRHHECWQRMCKPWSDGAGAGIVMLTYP